LDAYFNNYPANFDDDPVVQFFAGPSYGATPEQLRARRPRMRALTRAQDGMFAFVRDETHTYLERVRACYEEHYRDEHTLAAKLRRVEKLLDDINQCALSLVVL